MFQHFLVVLAAIALLSTPVLAQGTPQTTPQPPAKSAPKAAPKATTPKSEPAPVARKVNLNTANAQELDALPQIGPARAKAIIDARAKGPFKNWDDFVARNVVPSNAERAIKDLVSF